MKNYFRALECFLHEVFIGNTSLDEIDVAADLFEVLAMTCREIVDHSDARTAVAKRGCNVRTNEAGASCYDHYSR